MEILAFSFGVVVFLLASWQAAEKRRRMQLEQRRSELLIRAVQHMRSQRRAPRNTQLTDGVIS